MKCRPTCFPSLRAPTSRGKAMSRGRPLPPGVYSDWGQILRPDCIGTQNDNEGGDRNDNEGGDRNDNEGRDQNDNEGRDQNDRREAPGQKGAVTPGQSGVTAGRTSRLYQEVRLLGHVVADYVSRYFDGHRAIVLEVPVTVLVNLGLAKLHGPDAHL